MKKTAVIAIDGPANVLSPAQKKFNQLTQKIQELRETISIFQEDTQKIQLRARKDLVPLHIRFEEKKVELVRIFHGHFQTHKLKSGEKKKLHHLIVTMAGDLLQKGYDDLKEIYDQHSEIPYDEANAEADIATTEYMKEMMQEMFGIEFDDDADVSTPEKMQAYVQQKMAEAEAEKDRKAEEKRKATPKTEKQAAAEERRQKKEQQKKEEAKKISKSVREVYMELVKAFHPDTEPDETEKVRKTAIMQRITAAYEENDLVSLLSLQLEYEQISDANIQSMADSKIALFNKTLQQQVQELQNHLHEMRQQIAMMLNLPPYMNINLATIERQLNNEIKSLKKQNKAMEQDVAALRSFETLRYWLRDYEIPDADDFDFF
jgi:hypothetical protein